MSRLALALLALAGFAAPAAARELDGVVQTCRAARAVEVESAGFVEVRALRAPPRLSDEEPSATLFPARVERRYLLHGAWLI